MHKAMVTMWIVFLLSVSAAFGETAKAPKIIFEHTLYDFGYAGPGQKVKYNFRFTNNGDAKLIIEKVTACCGCSAELVPGKDIMPGEGGEIRTNCTMPRHEAVHKKTFTVLSNDPAADKIELAVTGRVKRGFAVVPQSINLGKVKKGQTISGFVRILQLSDDNLMLKKVDANDKLFIVKTHRFEGENHRGHHIDIILKPNLPAGLFKEVITLHTSMKQRPRIDVPVWAEISE
jgi:hypothetical protein